MLERPGPLHVLRYRQSTELQRCIHCCVIVCSAYADCFMCIETSQLRLSRWILEMMISRLLSMHHGVLR